MTPGGQVGPVAGHGGRHYAHFLGGVVGFKGHFIVKLEGADFLGRHLADGEVEDNGLLHPLVDGPLATFFGGRLGHAQLAFI